MIYDQQLAHFVECVIVIGAMALAGVVGYYFGYNDARRRNGIKS